MTYTLPFTGKTRLTCPFGKAGSWQAGFHIGVDLVGEADKLVHPIAAGTVESMNAHGSAYGNHVCVKHGDGKVSLYAHLAAVNVKKGQRVTVNHVLGRMGATGNATGPHLHLEVHRGAYRYPAAGSSPEQCSWLLNPAAVLGIKNTVGEVKRVVKEMTAVEAAQYVKEKAGLDENTMRFVGAYKYGNELVIKLAAAMEKGD